MNLKIQTVSRPTILAYFLTAWPTLAFLMPRTFFIRFLFSLRCLRVCFCRSYKPCRCNLCFGSNFLAKSNVSQINAKPVDRAPPKFVRNPKTKQTSGVTLQRTANFSRISFLFTDDKPGCSTSHTICLRHSSRLVINFRVRIVAVAMIVYAAYMEFQNDITWPVLMAVGPDCDNKS